MPLDQIVSLFSALISFAGLVFVALATLMTVLWRKELQMKKRRAA